MLDWTTKAGTNGLKGHTARMPGPQWGTITAMRTDQPMVGGSVATGGGLVFTGEGNGWCRAYDAATGERLWGYRARYGVNAPPISFELDGEQLIAVAAGGNENIGYPLGDEILVFGLPTKHKADD